MEFFLGPLIAFALLAIVAAAFWGGIRLARKLVTHRAGAIVLGLAFGVVFLVAGITALVAGCIAIAGSPSFR